MTVDEGLDAIVSLKKSEGEARALVDDAEKRHNDSVSAAGEQAKKILDKARQQCIEIKNKAAAESKRSLEKQTKQVISKAQKQAREIEASEVDAKVIDMQVKNIIRNYHA